MVKSLAIEIRHKNEIRCQQTENKDKLALFIENMIINIEKPQNKNTRTNKQI